jgi:predicted NACHT family NTPase
LPQKRVELYKLAADTLGRTWRTAAGVPDTALVDDQYLTRLLGRAAYWLHASKPSGIATQREVQDVLGQEWARIRRLDWDPDDPDPEIAEEVDRFLETVRIQTGLFVERAPRRYGFMHLTFEEYYAARHLVARRRTAAKLMRQSRPQSSERVSRRMRTALSRAFTRSCLGAITDLL